MEKRNWNDDGFGLSHEFIFIDIEATGLKRPISVVEIGAVSETGEVFNEYMLPFKPLEYAASQLTKLALRGGVLTHKKRPVWAKEPQYVFESFAEWVENTTTKPATLVAYNGMCYDFPVMAKHAKHCGVDMGDRKRKNGMALLRGVLDPLVYVRKSFKENKKFRLDLMMNQLGVEAEGTLHSALSDAKNLRMLFKAVMQGERELSIKDTPDCYKENQDFFPFVGELYEIE